MVKNRHRFFWFGIVLLILMPTISISLALLVKDEYSRIIISDISTPLYNLIATIALFLAAVNSRQISKRLSLGWGILAFAQLSFTLGDILWGVLELGFKITPFPSIADGPYLLFYPLFFAGILVFPSQRQSFSDWVKKALDVCIILVVAILGYWIFLISPLLQISGETSLLELVLTLAYPIGDLILFFALLVFIYYRSEYRAVGPIWILAFGSLVMIITDSIFSYQTLAGTYITGGFLDLGWLFSYIIVASAGLYQAFIAQVYKEGDTLPNRNLHRQEGILQVLSSIPYLWVIGAYFLLIFFHGSSQHINSNLLFIGVGFVILVVIIRQIITLNENKDLLSSLSNALGRVKQQAFELDKNNIILQDEIIERQRIQEQLAYDALHDGLTGLANRVLLMDRLSHAIEVTKREYEFTYSILFMDIDNFKTINDRLGHTVGDSVLFEIGQRLKNCTRSLDTVARYGGDEFVILLEYANEKNTAISVLDRILSDLNRPIFLNGIEVLITCSIGIVQEISEYSNSEDVLRDADFALYRAKEKGKAQYEIFDETMRTLAMTRLEIENDLRRAIANREFILNYQPIYILDKSKIIGLEALVRWQHPLRGLLMPSEFIPVAEETGLILQLGDWVLHEACTQMKNWQKEFPGLNFLSISVNISGKQINHKGFVDNVKHIVDLTGIDPSKLQLEITETALVDNQSLVNDVILNLQKIGVTFMIDDFGIGYSSLKYLQNFSVNTIKIDKSFIKDILDGNKGFELIKSIILMAQGMGMETIAEGIEDDEQLRKLISLNCKFGQGYLMSKPMNSRMVNESLRDHPGSSQAKKDILQSRV